LFTGADDVGVAVADTDVGIVDVEVANPLKVTFPARTSVSLCGASLGIVAVTATAVALSSGTKTLPSDQQNQSSCSVNTYTVIDPAELVEIVTLPLVDASANAVSTAVDATVDGGGVETIIDTDAGVDDLT